MTRPQDPGPLMTRLRREAHEQTRLLTIQLNITRRCNLSCRHCYRAPEREDDSSELTTEEIVSILDQAADMGALWLTLSGGEPLMRPDWPLILDAAARRRFAVTILTNGTFIDEQVADRLAAAHVWRLQVSLLGATAETHDALTRVSGSFDRTIRAMALLKERHLDVQAVVTAMAPNVREVPQVVNVLQGLGVEPLVGLRLTEGLGGNRMPESLRASDEDLAWLLALPEMQDVNMTALNDPIRPEVELAQADDSPCSAGHTTLAVNADGTVTPCMVMDWAVGRIREQSLAAIWHGSERLAEMRAIRRSDLHDCVSCDLRPWCTRCPAEALLEGRTLLDPVSESCRVARITAEVRSRRTEEARTPSLRPMEWKSKK